VPRPNAVLVVETLPEILSDKIRALLERRYLKGRDIFDLWYLSAPRLFTGFEMRDGFNLALPEKALLDTIYLRKAIPFRDELELTLLDRQRLVRMAKDFPGPTRKLVQEFRNSQ
jgi:hypothetical protein